MEYNQLTSLPKSIGNLTHLTELYLRKNQLTSLPESIGKLTNITEFVFECNLLTTLPESIGNLTNITELYRVVIYLIQPYLNLLGILRISLKYI